MRTINSKFYTTLFLCCFASLLLSQNYWKGGTPGAESDWNTPRNWSKNHIPNWADEVVIIPNISTASQHFPNIDTSIDPIPFLEIQSGAILDIAQEGELIIDGSTTYNYGILNIGKIRNHGLISVYDTALNNFESQNGVLENQGSLAFENSTIPLAIATSNNKKE